MVYDIVVCELRASLDRQSFGCCLYHVLLCARRTKYYHALMVCGVGSAKALAEMRVQ